MAAHVPSHWFGRLQERSSPQTLQNRSMPPSVVQSNKIIQEVIQQSHQQRSFSAVPLAQVLIQQYCGPSHASGADGGCLVLWMPRMASVTVTAEDLLPDIEEIFLSSPAEPRAALSRPLVGINAAPSIAAADGLDGAAGGAGLVDPSDQVDDTQNTETSKVPGTERLWIRYVRSHEASSAQQPTFTAARPVIMFGTLAAIILFRNCNETDHSSARSFHSTSPGASCA